MSTAVSMSRPESGIKAGEPAGVPPHQLIWTLTNAYVPARCLHLIAELGVADQIGEQPVPVADVATRLGLDANALDRVLSLLAAHGIFARLHGCYAHTPASRLLRSDHPMSMRAFPQMNGLPVFTTVFANLEHSLRTGAPAIETVDPGGLWAYLQDHPDEARIFAGAMTGRAKGDIAVVLEAIDFSSFNVIADIGGGRGHLLEAVLNSAPGTRGILFELPSVVATVAVEHPRFTTAAGDFFADALPAADAYLLMEILHDWSDDDCLRILSAIREAAMPGAHVLVIEEILDERGSDPGGHSLDVIMLAVTGGRERTLDELSELFAQAGFSRGSVITTRSRLRLVEATAI